VRAPECTTDGDCTRGTACDGVESCIDGVCENGDAPSCEHGTECDPDSTDGACVYTEQSPWVLVSFDDRVAGLPRHLLGTTPLVTLAESSDNASSSPFYYASWSPNGTDALVVTEELDNGQGLARLRFGAGLPAPLMPFANLPNWFRVEALGMTFASDGSRLAVHDALDGSLYLVGLEEPAAPTRRFEADIVAFCADPATWLGARGLVTPADDELVVIQELSGSLTLSPDARWVARDGAEAALVPCRADAEPVPLGFAATLTWSPGAGFLAAELEDGSVRILSVADPSSPTDVWTHANASFRGFSADGASVVVQLPDAERLSFVDLAATEPTATELLLDPSASIEMFGPQALLASQYVGEETVETLFWQPLRALQAPQPLVKGDIDSQDAARGAAILRVAADGMLVDTLLVRFDGDGFRLDPLAEVNAITLSTLVVAPDGGGIIQKYHLEARSLADWFPFDPKTGDVLPKVPLGVGVNWVEVQPWR
jgi:hypothetical protein